MVQSIHVRSYRPFALFLILSLLLLISAPPRAHAIGL